MPHLRLMVFLEGLTACDLMPKTAVGAVKGFIGLCSYIAASGQELVSDALIETSVLLGAVAAGVRGGPLYEALREFGAAVGLAFQIQDDILDVAGTTEQLGKSAGADAARAKPTYPSIVGIDEARRLATMQHDRAVAALAPLGGRAAGLVELAHFVTGRGN